MVIKECQSLTEKGPIIRSAIIKCAFEILPSESCLRYFKKKYTKSSV